MEPLCNGVRLAAENCTAFLASWKRLRKGRWCPRRIKRGCTAILATKKEIRGVGWYSSYFGRSLHCNFSHEEVDNAAVPGQIIGTLAS
jgi:hypothetical protein